MARRLIPYAGYDPDEHQVGRFDFAPVRHFSARPVKRRKLGRRHDEKVDRRRLDYARARIEMAGCALDCSLRRVRVQGYVEAIAMWGAGIDSAEIADTLALPEATIARWVASFRDQVRAVDA